LHNRTISYFGAVEELRKLHLLPRLISCCGSGAVVGAALAVLTDRELEELSLEPARLVGPTPLRRRYCLREVEPPIFLRADEDEWALRGLEPLLLDFHWFNENKVWAFSGIAGHNSSTGWAPPTPPSIETLTQLLRYQLGDETFLSAFQKTGRVLCVTVWAASSSSGVGQRFALSFATCPHVLLFSAVAKSVSGHARPLLALSETGTMEAFHLAGLPSERCETPFDSIEEPPLFFHAKRVIVLSLHTPKLMFLENTIAADASTRLNFNSIWPTVEIFAGAPSSQKPWQAWRVVLGTLARGVGFLREDIFARFKYLCQKCANQRPPKQHARSCKHPTTHIRSHAGASSQPTWAATSSRR